MNIKKLFTVVLLLFVAGSVGYMIVNEKKLATLAPEERIEPASDNTAPKHEGGEANTEPIMPSSITKTQLIKGVEQDNQLIVYYFHGDQRCPTCHKLETYAKEALDAYFADEIASKKIVWKAVNVDRTENSHFIKDYKLVTKSVVLSEVTNGKEVGWKNLDQIWQKVRDKDSYLQYIHDSILKNLKDTNS